uniref:SFRICE_009787 n=1 Tax=Spodoptera frugiperda TaxID=7108 RepID=A0A2H1VB37_SPOFR
MTKTMLDMVLLIEGILGVCRTYCRQKKTKKIIITLHLSLLVVLHTVLFFLQVYHLLPDNDYNQLNIIHCGFATSAYLTYMSAVITAIWYDKAYTSYDESINRLFKKFKDEKKLSDADKKAYWVFLFMIILAISFAGFRSVELNTLIPRAHPLAKAYIIMSLCVLRVTIVFEYLMFFIANMTLITFCKYQNSLISAAQKRLKFDVKCDIKKEEIQDWVDQYRDLVNCCQMVTKFCGGQKEVVVDYGKTSFIVFGYILVMMTPLFAGQMLNSQGIKYHRMLARLYNTITIDKAEAEGKLVKDFIRLLKKNPIQIHLVCGVPVGMCLLPITLSLFINYVIILLQFNHII